ncbi:hypothetical protein BJY04DRAFT_199816 [Aspergillus karnatakaensis]|uniref:uncharacterized protein n=1 Tax=Aspergillus karnatakaensis TaxID=1810916 RepID=UPI003CCD84C9
MLLCIIAIFASVHQTYAFTILLQYHTDHARVINTVWTLYELASRPEDQRLVREEMENILFVSHFESTDNDSKMSIDKLLWKKTPRLDSFIREVLRMKGEVLGSMRMTRTEIALGKYTIPKGMPLFSFLANTCSPSWRSQTARQSCTLPPHPSSTGRDG